jgi:hypothetical protein
VLSAAVRLDLQFRTGLPSFTPEECGFMALAVGVKQWYETESSAWRGNYFVSLAG